MAKRNVLHFTGIGSAFNASFGNTNAYFIDGTTLFMFDCGESVYARMLKLLQSKRIRRVIIIITHLHSDHIGSLGTVLSFCSHVVPKPVEIFYPTRAIERFLKCIGIKPLCSNRILSPGLIPPSLPTASAMRCKGPPAFCTASPMRENRLQDEPFPSGFSHSIKAALRSAADCPRHKSAASCAPSGSRISVAVGEPLCWRASRIMRCQRSVLPCEGGEYSPFTGTIRLTPHSAA